MDHEHIPSGMKIPTFTTFITTVSYIPGVVCLAKSLRLFQVNLPVLVVYTNKTVKDELEKQDISSIIRIHLIPIKAQTDHESSQTHNGVGALLHVDSPRRILFRSKKPFIYLDADLLCVSNPVEPFVKVVEQMKALDGITVAACTAFRLKTKQYNKGNKKGFNAGVIVCLSCSEEDNIKIDAAVAKAMEETMNNPKNATTEERILSEVFKERYLPLDAEFNLIKRVFKHSPKLWSKIKDFAIFVHYMGGKPWQSNEEKKLCDWDHEGYEVLEDFWHKVYSDQFLTGKELTEAFVLLQNPHNVLTAEGNQS